MASSSACVFMQQLSVGVVLTSCYIPSGTWGVLGEGGEAPVRLPCESHMVWLRLKVSACVKHSRPPPECWPECEPSLCFFPSSFLPLSRTQGGTSPGCPIPLKRSLSHLATCLVCLGDTLIGVLHKCDTTSGSGWNLLKISRLTEWRWSLQ